MTSWCRSEHGRKSKGRGRGRREGRSHTLWLRKRRGGGATAGEEREELWPERRELVQI